MKQPPASNLDAIHTRLLASMPPGPRACVLCGGAPDCMGTGVVDGVAIGYWICRACYRPGYPARITAKVRGEMFLRRRN